MGWFAEQLGYGEEKEFWSIVGLLHDLDYEKYPEEHCIKSQEIMRARGVDEAIIHATASHGYGITVDIQPEHQMEKVLFAADELTGLIGAAALMRPSKSVADMELKSLKKNSRTRSSPPGAPGTSSSRGREMLGWDRITSSTRTIHAGPRAAMWTKGIPYRVTTRVPGGTGMKKLCLGVLLCALLLAGCQGNTDQGTQDAASYGETIARPKNRPGVGLCRPNGQHPLCKRDLTAFVENLDLAHWTYQALPRRVQPLGSFVLFQEKYHPAGPDRGRRLDRTLPDHLYSGTA